MAQDTHPIPKGRKRRISRRNWAKARTKHSRTNKTLWCHVCHLGLRLELWQAWGPHPWACYLLHMWPPSWADSTQLLRLSSAESVFNILTSPSQLRLHLWCHTSALQGFQLWYALCGFSAFSPWILSINPITLVLWRWLNYCLATKIHIFSKT